MYCINCGVKLADTEQSCPLCGVRVYHPDIQRPAATPLYAAEHSNTNFHHVNTKAAHVVITTAFFLSAISFLLMDLQIHQQITWGGIVSGAIALVYVLTVLPTWFQKPNPVVFASIDFVTLGLYLWDVNQVTNGNWFLSLAFPVTGITAVIVITVTALLRYVGRGKLYIFGGAFILFGLFMPLLEFLVYITFDISKFFGWSIYPALVFAATGGILIFLAMIIFWLVAEKTGNFAIGSAVFGVLMLFFFRCKKPLYYAIVLVAAVAIWAAFRFGLGVLF